jgi:phosphotransferase system HPr-like phosphotransfer protein
VITSTVELLLAKAEAGEKQKLSEGEIERQVLEEFSECLASVMDLGTSVE